MNDKAVALPNTDREGVGPERLNGDIVNRHYLKHVVVDREVEVEVDSAIDDSKKIFPVLFKCLLKVRASSKFVIATNTVQSEKARLRG